MANDYEILNLRSEEQLMAALGVSELAGGDIPDCSRGVLLVRFKKHSPVTADDVSRILHDEWSNGNLPIIVVSTSGFAVDAFQAVSEYEDAHLFASSA